MTFHCTWNAKIKSIFKDENKPNQNTPAPPCIAASKAIAAIGLEHLMLQLLLIACIVSKYCMYGEVSLRCDSESNQFSRIWTRVACSLCVCGIECCPSKQWVLSGSEHTGLLCSASGVAVPPPCSRQWRGWVEFCSQSLCRKTARYFWFSFDFCPAEFKTFLFLS